jgi:hypothetical protein
MRNLIECKVFLNTFADYKIIIQKLEEDLPNFLSLP